MNQAEREWLQSQRCQSPSANDPVGQTPEDSAVSRQSSDAQLLRVPRHVTFLSQTDSSPRLPSPRSESSGPGESSSVEFIDDFPQPKRDLNAETQQVAALRQQRIEFAANGSSSVTTSPTRRVSAFEREEPSEVTYPEPRQSDVQRGSSSAGAATE